MTSQFEKYRANNSELTDEFFNTRFKDVDARLNALEAVLGQLSDAADTLLRIGITRLNTAVSAALVDFNAKSASIQEQADLLAIQTNELEELVAGLLETLGEEFHLDAGTF